MASRKRYLSISSSSGKGGNPHYRPQQRELRECHEPSTTGTARHGTECFLLERDRDGRAAMAIPGVDRE